jgi:hypothetical protein
LFNLCSPGYEFHERLALKQALGLLDEIRDIVADFVRIEPKPAYGFAKSSLR